MVPVVFIVESFDNPINFTQAVITRAITISSFRDLKVIYEWSLKEDILKSNI